MCEGKEIARANKQGALVAIVCALVLPVASGLVAPEINSAVAASATDFCHAPSANPYLKPLNRLPSLHEPPESGRLPFAPSVYMKPVSGPLVAHGENIGFTLPIRPSRDGKSRESPRWKVLATVSLLERDGQVRRVVKRIADFVRSTRATKLVFTTPARSATYRVDVVFERRDGSRVARYGQYFRAAPHRFGAKIAVSNKQVKPGDALYARLENTGVERIGAGYGYRIERFNGAAWEVDPSLQNDRPVPKVLVILGLAAAFDCMQLPIPADQSPGRYRFVKEVSKYNNSSRGHRRVVVTRSFTVSSP